VSSHQGVFEICNKGCEKPVQSKENTSYLVNIQIVKLPGKSLNCVKVKLGHTHQICKEILLVIKLLIQSAISFYGIPNID
jgi:hypothetical protein